MITVLLAASRLSVTFLRISNPSLVNETFSSRTMFPAGVWIVSFIGSVSCILSKGCRYCKRYR